MLSCNSDLDLTGLTLSDIRPDPRHPAEQGEPDIGSINARHLSVKGSIDLHALHRCGTKLFSDQLPSTLNCCFSALAESEQQDGRGKMRHVSYCCVPGFADLSNLQAGRLRVSAHSFDKPEAQEDQLKKIGLRLAGARLGELEVFDVLPGEHTVSGRRVSVGAGDEDFFPVPIDLGEIEVGVWSIGNPSRPRAERYRKLLKNDRRLRRSTYRTVELYLRNGGHEEDADAVYRAMKQRAEHERRTDARKRSLPRRYAVTAASLLILGALLSLFLRPSILAVLPSGLADWVTSYFTTLGVASALPLMLIGLLNPLIRYVIYKNLLRFGTSPMRVLGIILILWLAMHPAYVQPQNFEPSLASLARSQNPPAESAMPGEPGNPPWSIATAMFASLNTHVPMLNLMVRADWELKDSGTLLWRVRNDALGIEWTMPRWVFGTIAPEDWGVLMIIINWILWPLVLTFLIRKAVRAAS